MNDVQLDLNEKGRGYFRVSENGEQLGEMEIGIVGDRLVAYHTEVDPKAGGRGLGKKLLDAMADHARRNRLKVKPLCPYVHGQFKKNESLYGDIWDRSAGD